MSKVHDFIQRLCPAGVEHRPIEDVIVALRTGLNPRQNFELNGPDADNYYVTVRELGGFKLKLSHKTDRVDDLGLQLIQNRSRLRRGDVLFSATGTIGRTALVEEDPHDWNIKEGVYALTPVADRINSRFLIYLLQSSPILDRIQGQADGSTVVSISMAKLRKIRIPVPPLEVQREVVRILDQFTDLEGELEAELDAELDARRRQYVFYRDQLLAFPKAGAVRRIPIGDALLLRAGKFVSASDISGVQDASHMYPCFGGNGLRGYVATPNQEGDCVLIGRQGAWSGNVKRVSGKFYATEHAVVVTPLLDFDTSWLFHELVAMNLNQYVSQGAQPGLAVSNLKQVLMPVPHIDEQRRIAGILDKFDTLVSDLRVGLPGEFTGRRKQFEYYRDRLLTFEEAPA